MNHMPVFALLALTLQGTLSAQTGPATPVTNGDRQMDITGAMAEPLVYTPPTPADRWRYLYSGSSSPVTLAIVAGVAGYSHAIDSVPDWGQRSEGYGRRLGWVALNAYVRATHL